MWHFLHPVCGAQFISPSYLHYHISFSQNSCLEDIIPTLYISSLNDPERLSYLPNTTRRISGKTGIYMPFVWSTNPLTIFFKQQYFSIPNHAVSPWSQESQSLRAEECSLVCFVSLFEAQKAQSSPKNSVLWNLHKCICMCPGLICISRGSSDGYLFGTFYKFHNSVSPLGWERGNFTSNRMRSHEECWVS